MTMLVPSAETDSPLLISEVKPIVYMFSFTWEIETYIDVFIYVRDREILQFFNDMNKQCWISKLINEPLYPYACIGQHASVSRSHIGHTFLAHEDV